MTLLFTPSIFQYSKINESIKLGFQVQNSSTRFIQHGDKHFRGRLLPEKREPDSVS